jgi:hypothetical protein
LTSLRTESLGHHKYPSFSTTSLSFIIFTTTSGFLAEYQSAGDPTQFQTVRMAEQSAEQAMADIGEREQNYTPEGIWT